MSNGYNISSTHISLSLDVSGLSSSNQWAPIVYMKVGSQPTTSSYDAKFGPNREDVKWGGGSSVITFTGANSSSALRYTRGIGSSLVSSSYEVPSNSKIFFIVEFQECEYNSSTDTFVIHTGSKVGPLFQGYYFITPVWFPRYVQIKEKGWTNNKLKVNITFDKMFGNRFLGSPKFLISVQKNGQTVVVEQAYDVNWNATSETVAANFDLNEQEDYTFKLGWERSSSYHWDFPILWSNDQSYYIFVNFSSRQKPLYWHWNQSNQVAGGAATTAQTLAAYTAMGGTAPSKIWQTNADWRGAKGAFSNFSAALWNNMLSFVSQTRVNIGLSSSWQGTLCTHSAGDTLLASDLQILRINIQDILNQIYGSSTALIIYYDSASSKLDPSPGDIVKGEWFLSAFNALNLAIADYLGDTVVY